MTTSINPNTPVIDEARVESKIGEMTSFDQLDRITDEQIKEAKEQKKEATKAKKEEDPQPPPSPKKEKVDGDDLPKQSTADDDASITPTLGINPENLKPIKLTYGEEVYEILPTTQVPVKVDGEKAAVPLQELISDYSGKKAWDKRFNELNQERQQFKAEKRQLDSQKAFVEEKVNRFFEIADADPVKAIASLAELTGRDPIDFQKNFRANLIEKLKPYYNMDEVARREFDLTERERYLEDKRQAETEKVRRENLIKEEETRIRSALETYKIDPDTYFECRDELVKSAPKATVEPTHVIRYQRAMLAQKVVKEIRPDKAEDASVLGELAAMMVQNPGFTESDLKEIVQEIWKDEPSQASRNLSKKILKAQSQAKTGPKSAAVPKGDAWSFDQI